MNMSFLSLNHWIGNTGIRYFLSKYVQILFVGIYQLAESRDEAQRAVSALKGVEAELSAARERAEEQARQLLQKSSMFYHLSHLRFNLTKKFDKWKYQNKYQNWNITDPI